ncbi:MAG: hypothetical protein COA96_04855 [SAR86 cluster bacterium]|uniref:Flagellar protein FliT n=1 Tax=SAR86 cluster bacterium TaxID=2030880 RepID=A0A2A5B579_9GAMM|nr:MAG: hypothetical protein COA96_04855 [SAR86 cluster bacterium]
MLQLVSNKFAETEENKDDLDRQRRFQLAKLLQCTEQMLICAQKEDWDSVEEMEISRKEELVACFQDSLEAQSLLIAEAIATLIALNTQIALLVKNARTETMSEQNRLQSGKSAVHSYQQNQDSF